MKKAIAALASWVLVTLTPLAAEPTNAELEVAGIAVILRSGARHELKVNCDKLDEAGWQLLARVTQVKRIAFTGKAMTDRHLAMLTGMTELENFSLNGTVLTDDGYRHFAQFPNLQSIALWHPSRNVAAFTGTGLKHLKALPKLRSLTFAGATAGDLAYAAIAQLSQLTSFRQWHNTETAAGLLQLTKLPNLTTLTVGQRLPSRDNPAPSFTGDFLGALTAMKNLEFLDLKEARLSYADLAKLAELPNLKRLRIQQSAISEVDVERLRQDLPKIKIDWTPLTPAEEASILVKKLKI